MVMYGALTKSLRPNESTTERVLDTQPDPSSSEIDDAESQSSENQRHSTDKHKLLQTKDSPPILGWPPKAPLPSDHYRRSLGSNWVEVSQGAPNGQHTSDGSEGSGFEDTTAPSMVGYLGLSRSKPRIVVGKQAEEMHRESLSPPERKTLDIVPFDVLIGAIVALVVVMMQCGTTAISQWWSDRPVLITSDGDGRTDFQRARWLFGQLSLISDTHKTSGKEWVFLELFSELYDLRKSTLDSKIVSVYDEAKELPKLLEVKKFLKKNFWPVYGEALVEIISGDFASTSTNSVSDESRVGFQ